MFDVYMPPMKVRLSHRRSRRDGDVVFCVGSYPNRKFSRYSQSTLRIIGPSKLAILRTLTCYTGSKPSIGGSKILRVNNFFRIEVVVLHRFLLSQEDSGEDDDQSYFFEMG